jgi:hypothetical protein
LRGDLPKTISVDDKGGYEVPERFSNAAEVRTVFAMMIAADRTRAAMRSRVDGLVNGWPTYPKSVTASKGMGFMPRVNYQEAAGLIDAQATPLYDLITEVDQIIRISLDIKAESSEQLQDWENTIADEFTWLMLRRWRKSFNYHLPLSQREMLVHGIGAHVWPNQRWTPRTPRSGQILFPEGASVDFENEGDYFGLRDFVTGVNVYNFIRNEKAATKLGWNVDNVWKGLAKAARQNVRSQTAYGDADEMQRKFRRGDIGYWSTSQVGLWFNWLFVKEYEGGISLYLVDENLDVGKQGGGYYYKKRFQFDEWPLTLFPIDLGNGDLASIRGYGWKTKDFFELSNRINNAMAAQVLIGAFPMLSQTQPTVDPDKIKLMRGGGLNITPYGLKFEQIQFPQLNNTGLALQKHLSETLQSNNQSMSGSAPEPKDRETKYSFMLRNHDAARVTNGMQSLYESNLQQFDENVYRRVINTSKGDQPYQKMAQEFKDRCLAKGVPEEALKEHAIGEIRENTASGSGSAALRLQAVQVVMGSQVYANAPEEKKIAAERDLVAWTMGNVNVDRYARSVKDAQLPDVDESFAAQESNGLALGGDAVIGDGQNDLIHAQNHLAKAEELMQACEQGQEDPQKCLVGLQKLLQHAGQHLAKLQQNPTRQAEFKQLIEQWKEIAHYIPQLQEQIQEQQGQPSPEQQLSEGGQIQMAKLQSHDQIANKKADADIARKFRKDAVMERMTGAKTLSQMRMDGLKTATQLQLNNAKVQHGMTMDRMKMSRNGAK